MMRAHLRARKALAHGPMRYLEPLPLAGLQTPGDDTSLEKATNPFLRATDRGIRKRLGMEKATDAEVFGEIRKRKDAA